MFQGFFKTEYWVDATPGRSVLYVDSGRMLGGNSAFAHLGTYREVGDEIIGNIRVHRHKADPAFPSLLGVDDATLDLRGHADGNAFRFTGSSKQMPGAVFRSHMTRLEEDATPAAGAVGERGIINGLYSIHLRMLDGIDGDNTGVMLLHNGRILGGDAYFYYLGTYRSSDGRWKGELINQEHTPAREERPLFGGHEVGIGFSGTCSPTGATVEATAFAGKRSNRFNAVLTLIEAI